MSCCAPALPLMMPRRVTSPEPAPPQSARSGFRGRAEPAILGQQVQTQNRMTQLSPQRRPVGRPPFTALSLALVLALSGCGTTGIPDRPAVSAIIPAGNLLAGELVRSGRPVTGAGECWAGDLIPAVIETVTEQIEIAPARPASGGKPAVPASYQSRVQQRILSDRSDVWFLVPCPEQLTPDTVASLQRALKVRGLYRGAVTGGMDAATATAVRRFQAPQGLDSQKLSLAAARQLGLVAYAREG